MRYLFALAVLAACSVTEPLPSASLVGTYDVVSRNGKALPTWFQDGRFPDEPGRVRADTMRSAVLVVNADSSWRQDETWDGMTVHFVGWRVDADSAGNNFLIGPGSALYRRGRVIGDTLVVLNADGEWRLVRRR